MSEKSGTENGLIKHRKLLGTQTTDPELKLIDTVVQEYAPEIPRRVAPSRIFILFST